jgi:hypothetical protein
MLRVLSLVLAILIITALCILGAGYLSTPAYSDSLYVDIGYNPDLVWAELVNVENAHLKKSDVRSVEIIDRYGKLLAWQEDLKNGGYRIYRMNERDEGRRLVVELTESSYGLTGIWTFQLQRSIIGTELLVKEESTLTDIKTRGIRYFLGRNHDLLVWVKYIRVGLTERLLTTP